MSNDQIKKAYFFLTDECNASCPYCFVKHGTNVLSDEDIQNAMTKLPSNKYDEIVIFGGEPTLYPDILLKLVESLQSEERKNITVYSNGYNTSILELLDNLRVQVFINFDAYQGNLDKIKNFDWVFTIAPSNLDKVLDVYETFNQYKKYPNFKTVHYYTNGAEHWTDESVNKLKIILENLCSKYKEQLLKNGLNAIPEFIKSALMKLINRTTGGKNEHDCSSYITFLPNGEIRKCYGCLDLNRIVNCNGCFIESVCSINTPCFLDLPEEVKTPLCNVQKMIFETTIKLNSELKDETAWQQVVLNTCKRGFNNGHM